MQAAVAQAAHQVRVLGDEVGAPLGEEVLLDLPPLDLLAQLLDAACVLVRKLSSRRKTNFSSIVSRRSQIDLRAHEARAPLVELPDRAEVAVEAAAARAEHRRHRARDEEEVLAAVALRDEVAGGRGEACRGRGSGGAWRSCASRRVASRKRRPWMSCSSRRLPPASRWVDELLERVFALADGHGVHHVVLERVRGERRVMAAHDREAAVAERALRVGQHGARLVAVGGHRGGGDESGPELEQRRG